jgi:hypothetical protein
MTIVHSSKYSVFSLLTLASVFYFFPPRTLSKNVCVSRDGYYLSENVFKIGENCLLLLPQTGKKNRQKLFFYTSNANKMTLNQHIFIFFYIYLDSLNVLVDNY